MVQPRFFGAAAGAPRFDGGAAVVYNDPMTPNPVLRRLGLSDRDRAVIIHADDIGMCQATLVGLPELFVAGVVSSGAVMVPCPWFPLAARFAREHPDADLGVHLTLTCEWKSYRWGAVSTADPATGLLDAEGYLHATAEAVQERGEPTAVAREVEAQIERAIRGGMRPTHGDTHMGAVAHAKYMESYVSLTLKPGLPPMILRLDEEGWRRVAGEHRGANLSPEAVRRVVEMTRGREERGVPLLDAISGLSLSADPATRREQAKAALDALAPGVTHFIIHPARDTPELRAIAPDWACRDADFRTFCRPELVQHLRSQGIHVIGYRRHQELMRA